MKLLSSFLLLCISTFVFGEDVTFPATVAQDPYITAKSIRDNAGRIHLKLRSTSALVFDERDNEIILEQKAGKLMEVASLSKLMTAMVILDADLDMDDMITITKADKDRIRYSRSRLRFGMKFSREDCLRIALAASENRAALALARTYPGGTPAFIKAMNQKAKKLGLTQTRFADAAGLSNDNVSTARELVSLVRASSEYPLIREFTTQTRSSIIDRSNGREIVFGNTNRLVKKHSWPITLSKTGFTREAGNCLVMQTKINNRPVIMVLLESWGKLSKYGDSNRIRKWLIKTERLASRSQLAKSD
jgi:D-alanyl-D-alanine endopeptidase (penicillin-binding protein 7)